MLLQATTMTIIINYNASYKIYFLGDSWYLNPVSEAMGHTRIFGNTKLRPLVWKLFKGEQLDGMDWCQRWMGMCYVIVEMFTEFDFSSVFILNLAISTMQTNIFLLLTEI